MGPLLSSLVNLQSIDVELRQARKQLKKSQQAVIRQQKTIEQLQAAFTAKQEEIKHTHLQYSKLELELKSREEDISRHRVALNTAKTNKEYSAILTKINTEKADNSKLEDQILSLMNQIDSDQAICREIEENIKTETEKLDSISQKAEEKQALIQQEVDKLQHQYDQAASEVPDKERELFVRLAERYNGEVLAQVNQPQSRRSDRNCDGCFMTVPLEIANALMSRDEVITCPTCGRILVLDKQSTEKQPT